MSLSTIDGTVPSKSPISLSHPLRPVLVTVFALKFAVASLLVASACLAPSVSAESRYSVSD
ncbi:hypothetical protein [Rhizobium sp. SGZ-381]|uniref:hypothetical protein n=1 Tax=Rhizobium sp. SGZ-381 TaxID=3342800 RepID=UPI00366CDB4E